jgi:amino acid adenylation domain-containing protein
LNVKEQALWMLQRLVPDSGVSNEALVFGVDGRLDHALLTEQVRALVARHPRLRTTFPEMGGEPAALVHVPEEVSPEVTLFASPTVPVSEAVASFVATPFDIVNDIPIRAGLWRYPEGDVCCLALHHLAYDAWTAGILFAELAAGYDAALRGTEPVAAAGYVDASVEPSIDPVALSYWRDHVADVDAAAQRLPLGAPDPDVPTFAGGTREQVLPADVRSAVAALARRWRTTENMIYLAAYYLLLARHGAGPDLVVGIPVDVRDGGNRSAVGYHVNTLPVRVRVDLSQSFADFVAHTSRTLLTGLKHRSVPYEAVLPDLQAVGLNWRSPLFRYMFNYRPVPVPAESRLGGMPVRFIPAQSLHSRQDLEFVIETRDGEGWIRAVYSTEIFTDADIRALQERYETLLLTLGQHDSMADAQWWCPRDLDAVGTANDTADHTPIPMVGTAVLANDPTSIAIIDADREFTYGQLFGGAATVHGNLVTAGVQRGDVVAVYARRGAALAAATLGIWSVGAAYLPLHPDNPPAALGFQLSDAGCAAVLHDGPLPAELGNSCAALPLAEPAGTVPPPDLLPTPGERAYVIYTSGSTGAPKGVEITHDNLANLIAHFRQALDATADDAMLWLTTFAFDISALELFLPLSVGGRVVVAPDEARAEPKVALDLIRDHDVRLVQATPTTWATMAPAAVGALTGRRLLCGGEPLSAPLAADLLATGGRVHNVYGPTETTIWSTAAEISKSRVGPVTVGRPIRNTTVYVADESGVPLPPGMPGELCVAGRGVALGYLGRDDLTTDCFRVSPVVGRHYRTGDRARWRYDGTLEVLGRTDRQVKIRAHRLELGEVEAVLTAHPSVAVAAVVLRDDLPEHTRLVAFVQPATLGAAPSNLASTVWAHSRDRLPAYALPARLVVGPVPLNTNGKIDYCALQTAPLPDSSATAVSSQHDRTTGAVERLVDLWQELLDDPEIGPWDNFFLSGGHSLAAVRMLTQVRELSGVALPLTALLESPTPTLLARRLSEEGW